MKRRRCRCVALCLFVLQCGCCVLRQLRVTREKRFNEQGLSNLIFSAFVSILVLFCFVACSLFVLGCSEMAKTLCMAETWLGTVVWALNALDFVKRVARDSVL
ncbi:hypothetical protein VNO78_02818 [Psophocarpus tetragonolobus]|uniref:Uncharacterized protein n=1 Tax=Psophocarpus tetragonolobus TaxID=3891 RepID=A0AAN9T0Z7_PSOTE